jgi:hypothetical protein
MPGSYSETRRRFYDGLLPFMAELLQESQYVDRLGSQVHFMIQMLFPQNDAVFQDDNAPIHRAGTVQSWFKEHETNSSLVSRVTRFERHSTTQVSFGD